MERLLLLWDELDEFMVYGRHFARAVGHAVSSGGASLRRRFTA